MSSEIISSELVKKKEDIEIFSKSIEEEIRGLFSLRRSEAIFVSGVATILFTITGIWQLIVISGFIGGFFTKRARTGALVGFCGIFLGWMCLFIYYALTTEMLYFFEFWIVKTMGASMNWLYILWIICSMLGGIIGALGGINGTYTSRIIIEKLSNSRRFS